VGYNTVADNTVLSSFV